jgi:4-amino-4-deoxy-L-arabinose transferase-like glycosyltransferase
LQIGGLFTPGLLDDVDSIYIEIAREMLRRHDFITPYVNGIRFFDKPPLLYWMASSSMAVFGIKDWAARLPLALAVLALLLATYALGIRLFRSISPARSPDRGGFYAAMALATGIGPYLYTRFYIPDTLLALWMTLAVHLLLIALDRIRENQSALLPCTGFAAVMALNVLSKGLIGLVFPIAFVFLYLTLTRQLRLLFKLHLIPSTAVFLLIAGPWHILAALRNPPIPLPAGLELPARGGWAWFYLYNEHIARFLSKRVPHDYGQTPVWLFWLFAFLWIFPWAAFIPGALSKFSQVWNARVSDFHPNPPLQSSQRLSLRSASLILLLWAVIVLGFFTLSARQEYYSLPAIPALALMVGSLLARADSVNEIDARSSALRWHLYLLVPIATLIAAVCSYFAVTAPHPALGTDLSTLLAANPEFYNLSLGHLFDLTGAAMGLFRGPLTDVAAGMLILGPASYLLRRRRLTYAANLTLAAGMIVVLLAAHEGLVRFNPILGSKGLGEAINNAQDADPEPNDLIILDGELTSGSTLVFYTGQQVHLVNGRVNGLWYGSFWPDAPAIFETEATLHQLWASPRRIFLLTYTPAARIKDLGPYGSVHTLATAGGKTILSNR